MIIGVVMDFWRLGDFGYFERPVNFSTSSHFRSRYRRYDTICQYLIIDRCTMSPTKPDKRRSANSTRVTKSGTSQKSVAGSALSARDSKSVRVTSSSNMVAGRDPTPPKDRGKVIKGSIDSAGRVLVPAKMRQALDLKPGDGVNLELKGDVLQIRSLDDAINEAQALVRKHVPKKKSLVDELIAERRAEAKRE